MADNLITFADDTSAPQRNYRLAPKDVTFVNTLSKLFRVSSESVVLVESLSMRVILPQPDGKIDSSSLLSGETYAVQGAALDSSSVASPASSSPSPYRSLQSGRRSFGCYQPVPFRRPSSDQAQAISTRTFRRMQSPYNFQSQAGSSSDKYVRKIMMVKFDGRVKAGRRLYEQKGAALHLKASDIDMTVRGLTRLVEKRSREMGVSSSFLLTDAHGFQFSHDTCGPTDLRASSKKILACLKSNYEKHFGGSSETIATLLANSPDVRAEKSSQKLDVSAPLGKRRRLFDEETSTASPGSFSLPDKVDQVAADTASILRILSEADMAWIVDVLLYDLREAFTAQNW